MAGTTIRYEHTLKVGDYWRAYADLYRGGGAVALAIVVGFAILVFVGATLMSGGPAALSSETAVWFSGGASPSAYAAMAVLLLLAACWRWVKAGTNALGLLASPDHGHGCETTLDDHGVEITTFTTSIVVEWTDVRSIRADFRQATFVFRDDELHVMPRRAFSAASEYDAAIAFARARHDSTLETHLNPGPSAWTQSGAREIRFAHTVSIWDSARGDLMMTRRNWMIELVAVVALAGVALFTLAVVEGGPARFVPMAGEVFAARADWIVYAVLAGIVALGIFWPWLGAGLSMLRMLIFSERRGEPAQTVLADDGVHFFLTDRTISLEWRAISRIEAGDAVSIMVVPANNTFVQIPRCGFDRHADYWDAVAFARARITKAAAM